MGIPGKRTRVLSCARESIGKGEGEIMFDLGGNRHRPAGNLIKWSLVTIVLLTSAISTGYFLFPFHFRTDITAGDQSRTISPRASAAYGDLPLGFEPNRGQAESKFNFLSRGRGIKLFLSSTEALLQLQSVRTGAIAPSHADDIPRSALVRMKLSGASPRAEASDLEPLPGKVNYFIGSDPAHWITNVPTYAKVKYREIYPGIDLVYYGNRQQLEYDFVIAPGADPQKIALSIEGTERLEITGKGDLVMHTVNGPIVQHKPVIYQEVNGERQEIDGGYAQTGRQQIGFQIGDYDASRPVIIDPVLSLSYATYLGGSEQDGTTGIAVDAAGNAYVTGLTDSLNFPTKDPLQQAYGGGEIDAFVGKLNQTGTALVYATFLGGSDMDRGFGIAVDNSGSVYVVGQTASNNFPTKNAAQSVFGGAADIFVTKLNPNGSEITYSTYLGGIENDPGLGIAVDPAGNAYVTGWTNSTNFPLKQPLQSEFADGGGDAIVAKLNPMGSLIYSTFLGGNDFDRGLSIAADASGNAYLAGEARSNNFPTANALQPMKGSMAFSDAFVTKLNPDGSAFIYSTYLGGSFTDEGSGIAIDSSGNVYVSGTTRSTDFPTKNPIQSTLNGEENDAFIVKLNPSGSELVYSSYLGGSKAENDEFGCVIAVDAAGNAYVMGLTNSSDFPTKNPLPPYLGGVGLAFLAKINPTGSALAYSTYLGGGQDQPYFGGLAVDVYGNAYISLIGNDGNFPTTPGAFQSKLGGYYDGLIIKIAAIMSPHVSCVSAASYSRAYVAPESIVAAFGTDLATNIQAASMTPLPTELAGTSVKVKDSANAEQPAPLFYVSPGQVNFLIPAGLVEGTATVTVINGEGFVSTGPVIIRNTAPGLFTANADGQGVAAAVVLRVRADGSTGYEPVATFDTAQSRFVSVPIDLGAETDQVFLLLFGTGIRYRGLLGLTSASIGGADTQVVYIGPQGELVGLDQVNLRIPRSLKGRGDVDVVLIVNDVQANKVRVNIR
jgi:uncharacterized protein (TIGR03437 family)